MRDRRVERAQQVGPGINADQLGRLAERVEEGGHLGSAQGPGPVMILPADDNVRLILPVSVTRAKSTTPGTPSLGSGCPFSTPSTVAASWWPSARCAVVRLLAHLLTSACRQDVAGEGRDETR